ncbi:FAD binding domain-containing protein [Irpex rosettiformis]|uniref:FAD binding domain-containing protein n=1 Tax=Irpex rosettiformis TaxID=378272 RepID=A0ACB8U8G3_9APHY|nr:FAD binding domain-containing protein [Irpex rosettiformis]
MSVEPASILIVGAGPTGLILALALRQNNIPVRIIEKDTEFHKGQRGAGNQPRTLEIYNALGTLPDIFKEGHVPMPVASYKIQDGKEVVLKMDMVEVGEPTPDVPFRTPYLIGQSHNEEIHRRHLANYGTEVELGTELFDLTQDENGVTAELAHHKDGQETKETVRVKYLVSAEGARSVARKLLDIPFLGQTHDAMRLNLVDMQLKGVSRDVWHQWGDVGSKAVYIRPTEWPDVFSIMTGGSDVDCDLIHNDRQALIDLVVEVTKRDNLEFGDIIWQSVWRANVRMVEKFGKGRVFLIGDAAHVHSPTGGQGLNTGAQDAINLAWKLSLVLKYPSVQPSLLDSYENERLPVVRDMLFRTTELLKATVNYRAKGQDGTPAEPSHMRRPKILQQLGVNYRWSPIVVDEQPKEEGEEDVSGAYKPEDPSVLKAGDRAPDSPGLVRVDGNEKKKTLFDIFRPTRHTVLLFGENQEVLEVLKKAPAGSLYTVLVVPKENSATGAGVDAVFVDVDGYAHTFYPSVSKGFKTVIIRPDGVVGAIVKGKEGVEKYLKAVFGA